MTVATNNMERFILTFELFGYELTAHLRHMQPHFLERFGAVFFRLHELPTINAPASSLARFWSHPPFMIHTATPSKGDGLSEVLIA
ncbi:hypothetical protein [Burkholderia sp. LMG 13014]|uniref:hypothetical protein n=1 Tax=Burkholderia sp. LMG 13014 TaxID=2709306 RepID=UPI001965956F|nr:hypothetical protein [Burkholderia sp. LMG 13014]